MYKLFFLLCAFLNMQIKGELVQMDGKLCVKAQISTQNPNLYEIPLEELMDELIGKRVRIEAFELKTLEHISVSIPEAYKK